MACECIAVMDAKLAEHNSRLCVTFMFPRDGSPSYTQVTLDTEKLNTRNRKKASALATFCPFCGLRYSPESDEEAREPGQAAYTARFADAPARSFDPWEDLPPEVKAIWARVEAAR